MRSLLLALPLLLQGDALGPPINENGKVNFRDHVGIDQKLGDAIDLDLEFTDEEGERVRLGELFGERPVVLVLAYYECPMLCTLVLNGTVRALRALSDLDCGEDFDVVVVSIDPDESPALAREKRDGYVESYGRGDTTDGWHFLTGDAEPIAALAEQVGFRYVYDPKTDEYAHASGIMVLTPDGELSSYFYGVEFVAKDVKLGLVEAGEGEIGTLADRVLLLCYHYDPTTGRYGVAITNITRVLGGLTVLVLLGSIVRMVLRDRVARVRLQEAPRVG